MFFLFLYCDVYQCFNLFFVILSTWPINVRYIDLTARLRRSSNVKWYL